MTSESQELVIENHDLIYSYIHKYLNHDIEYWYDILAIGLCKAAISYDETKGYQFSTLVYRVFDNEVKQDYRKNNSSKHSGEFNCTSLDAILHINDDKEIENYSYISDSINVADECITRIHIDSIIKELDPLQRKILSYRLEGYDQRYIASMTNLSQSYVSRILKSIGNLIKS